MSDIYLSLTETPSVVTLSQPVISGALSSTVTVANTVTVALDANSLSALENVTVTVGAAVSISNFPSVTTVALDSASLVALENITVTVGSSVALAAGSAQVGSVTISNFPSTQTIAGTVTVGSLPDGVSFGQQLAEGYDVYGGAPVQIVGSSITQSISGTVTANMFGFDCVNNEYSPIPVLPYNEPIDCGNTVIARLTDTSGTDLNLANGVPISGTVTANLSSVPTHGVTIANSSVTASITGTVPVSISSVTIGAIGSSVTIPVRLFAEAEGGQSSGQDTLLNCDSSGQLLVNLKSGGSSVLGYDGNAFVQVKQVSGSSVTIGANPSGALTTRFGSVTTANTAQISAVTNTSRKYLLAQNISSGTVTIGIGFSPTTTQGIQLTAGGGLTFDAFCPTGAVYWLGAVTGAAYTILEG